MVHKLRRATPADAGAIAHVHVEAWRKAYTGILSPDVLAALSVEERASAWAGLLDSREGSLTIVAEPAEGELSGFCAMFLPTRDEDDAETTAEVGALYVAPESWRRKVGRGLMNAALEKAAAGGFVEAALWTFEANEGAFAFYAGFGFAPDGGRRSRLGRQDEIRLRLALV